MTLIVFNCYRPQYVTSRRYTVLGSVQIWECPHSFTSLLHLTYLPYLFFCSGLNITYIGFELNSFCSSGSIGFRLFCQQEAINENETFPQMGFLGTVVV